MIIWEPTGNAPAGYIKANGATISRAAYAWLFLRIGTTFGAGDGATTFKIPDLRGDFLRGLDDGRGVDAGRVLGSAQSDSFAAHSHGVKRMESNSSPTYPAGYWFDSGYASGQWNGENYPGVTGVVSYTENSGGVETRPRNVAGLYCIAIAP